MPLPYPRPGTSGTQQPLPTPGPELWEPLALCPLRPRLRNFGAPAPSQAPEFRGSPSYPQPPCPELRGPPALPLALELRVPRVTGAGSDSRAHPAGSAPRECPGASRVLPRGADSPQPGAPFACWLRGPRPPRRPPHRPRLCLRLRRRPRRLRSHRGRSRRGRRPPRLPGPPRPPRSAPCRPSAAGGRGRGRGGSREEGGTGPAGRGLRAGKRDWGWRWGQRPRPRGRDMGERHWRQTVENVASSSRQGWP